MVGRVLYVDQNTGGNAGWLGDDQLHKASGSVASFPSCLNQHDCHHSPAEDGTASHYLCATFPEPRKPVPDEARLIPPLRAGEGVLHCPTPTNNTCPRTTDRQLAYAPVTDAYRASRLGQCAPLHTPGPGPVIALGNRPGAGWILPSLASKLLRRPLLRPKRQAREYCLLIKTCSAAPCAGSLAQTIRICIRTLGTPYIYSHNAPI